MDVVNILASLKQCQDLKVLRQIVSDKIWGVPAISANPRSVPNEVFITLAETALALGEQDIAATTCKLFHATNPIRTTQYCCRILLVQAQLEELHLRGAEYVTMMLKHINLVEQALDIAKQLNVETFGFLIYNVSVVYYNVSRPLMKEHYKELLIPSMSRIIEALESLPQEQSDLLWLTRCTVNLAAAYDDAGQSDAAAKTITKAWNSLKQVSTNLDTPPPTELSELVIRQLAWIYRGKEGQISSVMNDIEKSGEDALYPGVKTVFLLQKCRNNLMKPEDIEKTLLSCFERLQNELSSNLSSTGGGQPDKKTVTQGKKKKGRPGKELKDKGGVKATPGPTKAEDEESPAHFLDTPEASLRGVVALVGREAASNGMIDLAKKCMEMTLPVKKYGPHRSWILSLFTQAEVLLMEGEASQVERQGIYTSQELDEPMLQCRIDASKIMMEALMAAFRRDERDVLEEGVVLAWNICLPLLQSAYVSQVSKLLRFLAFILEEIQSAMLLLRVQLHLQITKLDIIDDFLVNARKELEKALELDYTLPVQKLDPMLQGFLEQHRSMGAPDKPETKNSRNDSNTNENEKELDEAALAEVKRLEELAARKQKVTSDNIEKQFQRPYDNYLLPLHQKLALSQNLWEDPETAEERAILLLEQSKSSKAISVVKGVLAKASRELEKLEEKTKHDADDVDDEDLDDVTSDRARCEIWCDMMDVAWKSDALSDICLFAIDKALSFKLHPILDKPLLLRQATALSRKVTLKSREMERLKFGMGLTDRTFKEEKEEAIAIEEEAEEFLSDDEEEELEVEEQVKLKTKIRKKPQTQRERDYETAMQIESDVVECLINTMKIGQVLEEDHVVLNACTQLWNIFLPLFQLQEDLSIVDNFATGSSPPEEEALTARSDKTETKSKKGGKKGGARAKEQMAVVAVSIASQNILPENVHKLLAFAHEALTALPTKKIDLVCKVTHTFARSLEQDAKFNEACVVCLDAFNTSLFPAGAKQKIIELYARCSVHALMASNQLATINSRIPKGREAAVIFCLELLRSAELNANMKSGILRDCLKFMKSPYLSGLDQKLFTNARGMKGGDKQPKKAVKEVNKKTGKKNQAKASLHGDAASFFQAQESASSTFSMLGAEAADGHYASLLRYEDAVQKLAQNAIGESRSQAEEDDRQLEIETALFSELALQSFIMTEYYTSMEMSTLSLATLPAAIQIHHKVGGAVSNADGPANNYPRGRRNSTAGMSLPVNAEAEIATVSHTRWRFYSIAESTYGRNIAQLIDPEKHDQISQDKLKVKSLGHLEAAGYYALLACKAQVKNPDFDAKRHASPLIKTATLVLLAAKEIWHTAATFLGNPLTRGAIAVLLRSIVQHLDSTVALLRQTNPNGGTDILDADFRCALYRVNLQCYRDNFEWQEGYVASACALDSLPARLSRQIWTYRVIFMNKLGMNVRIGVTQMKDKNPVLQARLWSSLARSSPSKLDQFAFYQQSIQCISQHVEKVEFMLSYAEFLFTQHFANDAKDQLLLCVDYLSQLEAVNLLELEDEVRSVGSFASSRYRRPRGFNPLRRRGSQASFASQFSTFSSATAMTAMTAKTDRLAAPNASQFGGSKRAMSPGGASVASQATSRSQYGEEKQSEHVTLTVRDYLFYVRIYTMLAQMATDMEERRTYCLLAVHYVCAMTELSCSTYSMLVKREKKKRAKIKKMNDAAARDAKRTAPAIAISDVELESVNLPTAPKEWIGFNFPTIYEELVKGTDVDVLFAGKPQQEAQMNRRGSVSSISTSTTVRAARDQRKRKLKSKVSPFFLSKATFDDSDEDTLLFLHYFMTLSDYLVDFGLLVQALPVLLAAKHIGSFVLGNRAIASLLSLRQADVYYALHLPKLAQYFVDASAPILPTKEEDEKFMQELDQTKLLKKVARENEAKRLAMKEASKNTQVRRTDKVLHALSAEDAESEGHASDHKLPIRKVWLLQVALLFKFGQYHLCKQLLTMCYMHCDAFEDHVLRQRCHYYLAQILAAEGNVDEAYELMFQSISKDTKQTLAPVEWVNTVSHLVTFGRAKTIKNAVPALEENFFTEREALLRHALSVMQSLYEQKQVVGRVDIGKSVCGLMTQMSEYYVRDTALYSPFHPLAGVPRQLVLRASSIFNPDSKAKITALLTRQDFGRALNYLSDALELGETLKDPLTTVDTLLALGQLFFWKSSVSFFADSTRHAHVSGDLFASVHVLRKAETVCQQLLADVGVSFGDKFSLPCVTRLAQIKLLLAEAYLRIDAQSSFEKRQVMRPSTVRRSPEPEQIEPQPTVVGDVKTQDEVAADLDELLAEPKQSPATEDGVVPPINMDALVNGMTIDTNASARKVSPKPLPEVAAEYRAAHSGLSTSSSRAKELDEAAMTRMFFGRFENVFGSMQGEKSVSYGQLALVLASSAVSLLTRSPSSIAQLSRAYMLMGTALNVLHATHEAEKQEQDAFNAQTKLNTSPSDKSVEDIEAKRKRLEEEELNKLQALRSTSATPVTAKGNKDKKKSTKGGKTPVGNQKTDAKALLKSQMDEQQKENERKRVADGIAQLRKEYFGDYDFSYDETNWSPVYVVDAVAQLLWRKKEEEDVVDNKKRSKKLVSASSMNLKGGPSKGKGKPAKKGAVVAAPTQQDPLQDGALESLIVSPNSQVDYAGSSRAHFLHSLRYAVEENDHDSLGAAALGLVETIGTTDMASSIKFLSLYVIARVKEHALKLFVEAAAADNVDRLAILRRDTIAQTFREIHNKDDLSPEWKALNNYLDRHSHVWKMLSFSSNPAQDAFIAAEEEDKEKTTNLGIQSPATAFESTYSHCVSLLRAGTFITTLYYVPEQHSLYLTVSGPSDDTKSRVCKFRFSESEELQLVELVAAFTDWRRRLRRLTLVSGNIEELEVEYTNLCNALRAWFVSVIDQAVIDPLTFFTGLSVIVIADPVLASLPLEELSLFTTASSVSREFSLLFLYKRLIAHGEKPISPASVGFMVDHDQEEAPDKPVLTEALRSLVNARKEDGCKLWEGNLSVDLEHPASGKKGSRKTSPRKEQTSARALMSPSASARGGASARGLNSARDQKVASAGSNAQYVPVLADWEYLLTAKDTFLYMGYENFLSHVSTAVISRLSLPALSFLHLAGNSSNEVSFRKQAKLDNNNRGRINDICFSHYETALLLSLRGCTSLLTHAYSISATSNAHFTQEVWSLLLSGVSVGQAVQFRRSSEQQRAVLTPAMREAISGPGSPKKSSDKKKQASGNSPRKALPHESLSFESPSNVMGNIRPFDRGNCVLYGLPSITFGKGE